MEELGIDTADYNVFTDTITAKQGRYIPNTISAEKLFTPTVKAYLENSG